MSKAKQINRYLDQQNRQLLSIYCWYRLILSLLLGLAPFLSTYVVAGYQPQLYLSVALGLILLNLFSLIWLRLQSYKTDHSKNFTLFFIDALGLILLMHASGGLGSGLGYLLIIVAATASVLLPRQLALLIAALSSLGVLSDSVFLLYSGVLSSKVLFASSSLGFLLFCTALLFQYAAQRLRQSQTETQNQALEVRQQRKLSESIVERMQTGVLVVNKAQHVSLINRAAKQLLFNSTKQTPQTPFAIGLLSEIHSQLEIWQAYKHTQSSTIKALGHEQELQINFAQLESHDHSDTLIFVEETRRLSQQAQQLKLASLGRLTASIAHEIRNPLGAISHAAQLLNESELLNAEDKHLSEIIHKHTQRANAIIENVLFLSQRKHSQAQKIPLSEWLQKFSENYQDSHPQSLNIERLHGNHPDLSINADPSQLQQVLTNLFDNGLRHGFAVTGQWHICIKSDLEKETGLPKLHIIDDGLGIAESQLEHLFEPFFTTENEGTGLGLYLANELCHANQATLNYRKIDGKSCFTISFAHPNRLI